MTGVRQCQPMCVEPSPEELQAWADEAQACLDSGEVFVSDHRKAHATIMALRSRAALVKALEDAREFIVADMPYFSPSVILDKIDAALSNSRSAKT